MKSKKSSSNKKQFRQWPPMHPIPLETCHDLIGHELLTQLNTSSCPSGLFSTRQVLYVGRYDKKMANRKINACKWLVHVGKNYYMLLICS